MPKKRPISVQFTAPLEGLREMGSESLSLFSEQAIRIELEALAEALDLPPAPQSVDIEDDEWADIMSHLLSGLGATPLEPVMDKLHLFDDENWRRAVAWRVRQALAGLEYSSRLVDEHGGPTALLLPTSYSRRIRMVVGYANLPVAWVRAVDVARL